MDKVTRRPQTALHPGSKANLRRPAWGHPNTCDPKDSINSVSKVPLGAPLRTSTAPRLNPKTNFNPSYANKSASKPRSPRPVSSTTTPVSNDQIHVHSRGFSAGSSEYDSDTPTCNHGRNALQQQKKQKLPLILQEAGDLETINLTNAADMKSRAFKKNKFVAEKEDLDAYEVGPEDPTATASEVSSESSANGSTAGAGGDCHVVSARRYISVESLVLEDNFDTSYTKSSNALAQAHSPEESEPLPQVKIAWNTPPLGSPRAPKVTETPRLTPRNDPARENILNFFTRTQEDGTEREGRYDNVEAVVTRYYTRTVDDDGVAVKSLNLENVIENLDEFVLQPAALGYNVQCRVTRDRKGVDRGLYPTYYMHLERPDGRKVLLLTGRKRKKSTTSNYLISTDAADLSRDSNHFVGKVRSNLLGTQFLIYDSGESHKRFGLFQNYGAKAPSAREELAAVIYEPNVLGFKGPRKMKILIPEMRNEAQRREHRPEKETESVLELHKNGETLDFFELRNKAPIWNNDNQSFVLNFHGRVTQASVKNFQVIHELKEDYVLLQFGRVASDLFTMDFRWPLCPLQAFAIVLTSFDNKLACE